MARRAPFGSFHEDPPALIREHAPLFDWARSQAAAIAETREKLASKRCDLEEITTVVEESGEFGEVEEAKERLKKAKQDAMDCSPVQTATEALRKARKALRRVAATKTLRAIKKEVDVLRMVIDESKDRLASGLAAGKVPQTVPDDVAGKVARHVANAVDALARGAGEGGSVTLSSGGESVTIPGKGKRGVAAS